MRELTPATDGYPIKLVRDRTAEILNSSGKPGELWYGPLSEADDAQRMRWLRLKLAEELGEYLVDGGEEELTDIVAVMQALAVEHGTTLQGLIVKVEASERGGFFTGTMMFGRHEEFDGRGD